MEHTAPSEGMEGPTDGESITDHVHETSWSANLERTDHAEDRDLVVTQAIEAVDMTASGTHVNLVTHSDHGHPSTYLYDALIGAFGEKAIEFEYVDQCGCGGHVTRVHV